MTKKEQEMKNYQCPNCEAKLPLDIKTLIKNKNIETICNNCNTSLKAKKTVNWNTGYIIGFLSVIIPGYLSFFFKKPFGFALLLSLLSASIVLSLFILYLYVTTEFIKDD